MEGKRRSHRKTQRQGSHWTEAIGWRVAGGEGGSLLDFVTGTRSPPERERGLEAGDGNCYSIGSVRWLDNAARNTKPLYVMPIIITRVSGY